MSHLRKKVRLTNNSAICDHYVTAIIHLLLTTLEFWLMKLKSRK